MNTKQITLAGFLLFAFCFFSCNSTKKVPVATESKTVTISLSDNGKTYDLKLNEKFDATFNECIGCAEVWKISEIDKEKIEVLPNTYSNKSCTDCVGGNQDNTFHFQVKSAGKSTLSFSYFDKKVSVTINAK